MTARLRRLVSALVSYTVEPMTLPPGVDRLTFDRLHALGYTSDDALWLCDFFTLCAASLRQYDAAATS